MFGGMGQKPSGEGSEREIGELQAIKDRLPAVSGSNEAAEHPTSPADPLADFGLLERAGAAYEQNAPTPQDQSIANQHIAEIAGSTDRTQESQEKIAEELDKIRATIADNGGVGSNREHQKEGDGREFLEDVLDAA